MDYMSFLMAFFGKRFQSKFEFSFCPVWLYGVKWETGEGLKNNIFNVWDDDGPCGVVLVFGVILQDKLMIFIHWGGIGQFWTNYRERGG